LLVLFAVLLGLTALVTSLAPRPTVSRPGLAQVTPTPTPTPEATRAPTTSRRIVKTISASAGAPRAKIHARVGDILALQVKGDVLDSVEIMDGGGVEPVEPGSPARFELLLDRQGELRVDLVDAQRLIGLIEVGRAQS
jgi:hypothetical protein